MIYSKGLSLYCSNIMKKKKFPILASLMIWGLIIITSYYFSLSKEIEIDKLLEMSPLNIWIKNLFVLGLYISGIFTYGISTIILIVSNATYIGYIVIPYVKHYSQIHPLIWIFVVLELFSYILASSIGLPNFLRLFNVKMRKNYKVDLALTILCSLLLLLAAFLENHDINYINSQLELLCNI